jgi:homoserine kinase
MRAAAVRVPGSTSNLGAGFDCVGLAIERHLTARFAPGGAGLRLRLAGTLADLPGEPADDLLARAFLARLGAPDADVAGELSVESGIPVGRGLGSSAAATVAGLLLADAVAGRAAADPTELLQQAALLEGHADNAAPALFGGLVAVARDAAGRALAVPLALSDAIGFAYAAPGQMLETAAARSALPAAVAHATAARALGRLAALLEGLARGEPELLRVGFADDLHVPYRMPLIPGATEASAAACDAGAWAVTISGAGTGLIAASPPDHTAAVAAAMAEAFAREAGPTGVIAFACPPALQGATLLPV